VTELEKFVAYRYLAFIAAADKLHRVLPGTVIDELESFGWIYQEGPDIFLTESGRKQFASQAANLLGGAL